MLSILSIIFAAALGVPGGRDIYRTLILRSVVPVCYLKQLCAEAQSSDGVAVLPGFNGHCCNFLQFLQCTCNPILAIHLIKAFSNFGPGILNIFLCLAIFHPPFGRAITDNLTGWLAKAD